MSASFMVCDLRSRSGADIIPFYLTSLVAVELRGQRSEALGLRRASFSSLVGVFDAVIPRLEVRHRLLTARRVTALAEPSFLWLMRTPSFLSYKLAE